MLQQPDWEPWLRACVLQAEQQGEAGDVLVPLGPEQFHVDVLDGRGVVGQVHLLRHAVLPHLAESVCGHTESQSGRVQQERSATVS